LIANKRWLSGTLSGERAERAATHLKRSRGASGLEPVNRSISAAASSVRANTSSIQARFQKCVSGSCRTRYESSSVKLFCSMAKEAIRQISSNCVIACSAALAENKIEDRNHADQFRGLRQYRFNFDAVFLANEASSPTKDGLVDDGAGSNTRQKWPVRARPGY